MSESTTVMLRCGNCLTLNRVPRERLSFSPVCGNCKTVMDFPRQPVSARSDSFDRETTHWPETLLVMFTSTACLYCKIFAPIVNGLANDRAGKLKIILVDCDTQTDLTERYKIEKTPTFIVFQDGEEVLRVDGPPKDKTDLVKWIDNLIGTPGH